MTTKEKAVLDAAREIASMQAPTLPKILEKNGYGYEAKRVQALLDAVTALPSPQK